MNIIIKKLLLLFMIGQLIAQYQMPNDISKKNNLSSERYFTSENGTILMNINVWGHVNNPGQHVVVDGVDIPTLLSVVGGPKIGANLKKIKVFREYPDKNGKTSYIINLSDFTNDGNRRSFIKILPNDTFIISQTTTNYLLSQAGTMNVFLSMLNIYLQIESR